MYFRILSGLLSLIFILPNVVFSQHNFEKDFFNHYPKYEFDSDQRSPQSVNTGNYDVVYCRLELTVDPEVYYIDGVAKTSFIPKEDGVNTIYFDFTEQITVNNVEFRGNAVAFEQLQGDELKIDLMEDLPRGVMEEVVIYYSGQPASSGFGSFAIATQCGDDAIPSMWTLSEPYGAKHWWPCKQTLNDKYDSIDIVINTPQQYRAASNGLLINEEALNDGTKTYTWSHRYPIPAYLVAFAVSEYEVYSDMVPIENDEFIEVLNYIFPCNLEYAKSRTPNTIPIMQFFREKFGEYPYVNEKYGHCNFGWGGGMEHSTMSFMGGFSHLLIAHELAHQWFGDKITCGSWQDIWLNEGFATYLEGLTYDFGADPGGWTNWKSKNLNRATNDPTGTVWVNDTTSVNRIFSGNLSYSKGSYLLHMLRWKLGEDTFFTAINNYIHDPELIYSYARTSDLQKHLEEASGMDLEEFFNDWFYGGGYPIYEIIWEQNNSGTWVTVNQTHSDQNSDVFFDMPIPILFNGFSKDTTIIFDPQKSGELFQLDIPFSVTNVAFDPELWICAKNQVLTSVSKIDENEVSVFPNPAGDFIRIKAISNDEVDLELVDMFGKSLIKQKARAKQGEYISMNLESLPSGVYSLVVEDKSVRSVVQVVKE